VTKLFTEHKMTIFQRRMQYSAETKHELPG